MKRYLVDLRLNYVAENGDERAEASTSNPVEIEETGNSARDFETAGRLVAEAARAQFHADYGPDGDLTITVPRIIELVPAAG